MPAHVCTTFDRTGNALGAAAGQRIVGVGESAPRLWAHVFKAVPDSSARNMMPWPVEDQATQKLPSASMASTVTAVPTITTTMGRGSPWARMRW